MCLLSVSQSIRWSFFCFQRCQELWGYPQKISLIFFIRLIESGRLCFLFVSRFLPSECRFKSTEEIWVLRSLCKILWWGHNSQSTLSYTNILQKLSGFLFVVNSQGRIVIVTDNIKQYLGYEPGEWVEQSIYDFLHVINHAVFGQNLLHLMGGKLSDWGFSV